jgi:hypothetical protein
MSHTLRCRWLAALAMSMPLAAAMPAAAQQDPAQAQEQYWALSQQVGERAGDPAFDYALGIAALDSGR